MKLKLHGLKKSFHQGPSQLQILSDLMLDLPTGQVAAIIGQSGSGKSTLLSILAGFENADSGEIFWDDQWHEAQPTEDSFLVYGGMLAQLYTKGEVKALCHRVVNTTETKRNGRYSIVLFIDFGDRVYDKKKHGRLEGVEKLRYSAIQRKVECKTAGLCQTARHVLKYFLLWLILLGVQVP